MKKVYILFTLLVYWCNFSSFSQGLTIKSVTWKETDSSASKRYVLDNNLDTCALIKVFTPIPDITFEGNVVEMHKSATCYWIYVTPGTRSFTAYHRSLFPSEINAQIYDISDFKQGRTYYVITSLPIEIEEMLCGIFTRVKMTRERKEMIRLDRQYYIADSLYRKASRVRDEDIKKKLLEESSSHGWPLATIELVKLQDKNAWLNLWTIESYLSGELDIENSNLRISPQLIRAYPKIKKQYEQLDKYLDWMYREIKPFDDILKCDYAAAYRFMSSSIPSNEELLIRDKEAKIKSYKKAIDLYLNTRRPFKWNKDSYSWNINVNVIERDMPFVPTDREATYLFYQMKRLWYDIIKLAKRLPSVRFHGVDVSGL